MLAVGAAGDTADPCGQGGAPWGKKSLRKVKKTEQEKSEGGKKCEKPSTDKRKRRSKAENSQRSLPALVGDHGGASIYTAVQTPPWRSWIFLKDIADLESPCSSSRYEKEGAAEKSCYGLTKPPFPIPLVPLGIRVKRFGFLFFVSHHPTLF